MWRPRRLGGGVPTALAHCGEQWRATAASKKRRALLTDLPAPGGDVTAACERGFWLLWSARGLGPGLKGVGWDWA